MSRLVTEWRNYPFVVWLFDASPIPARYSSVLHSHGCTLQVRSVPIAFLHSVRMGIR